VSLPTRSVPATSLSISRRLARAAVEFLPPFAVALLILPYIIQYGKLIPWHPSTIDLQVYVYAVKDMLAGKDIFATTTPFWNLYFIYPPIAAILMTPLAFGPYVFWQVVWTGGLVWAQQSVLKRCGAPRGWKLGLIGIAVVLAVEPIRTTLGYGQVNTILMALVVADLLPDAPGERRRIPQGTLIGLAAAIKLTPALFVIFAFLIGKTRVAITAVISFAVFTGIGAILLFRETLVFFGGLSGGDTRTASPLYAGNQSLLGVFFRLGGSSRTTTLLGLAVSGVLAVLGCLVAAYWWRNGEKVFAVALVGLQVVPRQRQHHHAQQDHDQRLPQPQSSQKQAHDCDWQVGERRSQVRLYQNHQHGDTHDCPCLDEVRPSELTLAQIGEVFGHGNDQDQLDPLGGLKVRAPGHLDPTAGPQILLPKHQHHH